jgi:HD-GYP domain-containing protein (c-di-GMP phosphodiesterase class II)
LGLPDDRVRGIFLAATLHDIGKIQVPAQILSKPGPLTDVEMAIIRTHPEAGYQILKNVEFPWPIATMVLQHHERLDGSGYPDGLRGQEIPLESRILAVADAVEARTSYRPYRPARDEGEMWKELTGRLSGEFDQAVVAACRAVWPELHERQKQVADSG